MFKSRLALVITASVLGVLSTMVAGLYLKQLEARVNRGEEMTAVYVAKNNVAAGARISEAVESQDVVETRMPRKYIAGGAVTAAELDGQVLAVPLEEGEQLTKSKLELSEKSGLAVRIPENHVATAIEVDDVIGVSNLIRPEDDVMVIATFEAADSGPDISRIILSNVRVLATDGKLTDADSAKDTPAQNSEKRTITVAVPPDAAEKLVFAQEKGSVFLALHPATGAPTDMASPGATWDSIFD